MPNDARPGWWDRPITPRKLAWMLVGSILWYLLLRPVAGWLS